MLGSKIKKRFLLSALIAVFGQVALVVYMNKIHSALTWQLIVGSSLLIIGSLLSYNFILMKKTVFKDKKFLFWAIIFNPCLVSIFSGIAAITHNNPGLQLLYTTSVILAILNVILGGGTLLTAFIRREPQ